jgi:hypothetical protein
MILQEVRLFSLNRLPLGAGEAIGSNGIPTNLTEWFTNVVLGKKLYTYLRILGILENMLM